MKKHFSIAIFLLCFGIIESAAQDSSPKYKGRLDSVLSTHYFKQSYDTNYVKRPSQKWLLRVMVNQMGNHIHAKGTVNGIWSKYDLQTRKNTTLSLEVNYCDIAATLSLNPAKLSGHTDDYELNVEYHGTRFSIDVNYQRSSSLAGDIEWGDVKRLDEDGIRMKVLNITGYYTFNHRRFSFPAALYQNYYQIRSAGSWLAGFSYQGGSIKTTDELKARSPESPVVNLHVGHFGIGGGYGYNLVLGKRSEWLFHLSAMPTVVVYNHNKLLINNEHIHAKHVRINMIFNERAAIVYHFSPRYHAGISMMMSNSLFDDKAVKVNQNKLLARAFFGFRL